MSEANGATLPEVLKGFSLGNLPRPEVRTAGRQFVSRAIRDKVRRRAAMGGPGRGWALPLRLAAERIPPWKRDGGRPFRKRPEGLLG